eukprot:1270860-Prymnesium_polylepis.1
MCAQSIKVVHEIGRLGLAPLAVLRADGDRDAGQRVSMHSGRPRPLVPGTPGGHAEHEKAVCTGSGNERRSRIDVHQRRRLTQPR